MKLTVAREDIDPSAPGVRTSQLGQVAIVTGASQGISRATALTLAEAGADIVINHVVFSRLEAIPLPDGHVDLVISNCVVECRRIRSRFSARLSGSCALGGAWASVT
jgi:hypothetical protein